MLVVVLVVLGAGGAAVAGYATARSVRAEHLRRAVVAPTPSIALAAGVAPRSSPVPAASTAPRPAALARALSSALTAPGLGERLRARIVDITSGAVLLDRTGAAPAAPASTAKLLTAAALYSVRAPTDRLRTVVRTGTGGAVVLVGGGDPTLTGAAAGEPSAYAGAARVRDLAAQLRRANVHPSSIIVDDSLFSGPAVSPAWAPEDIPSDYAAPITAVLVDGGRDEPTDEIRSTQPDLAAGRALARALGAADLPVTRGTAPTGSRVLATVRSAPLRTLVDEMLERSDNVIAECLARQVALASGRPATFRGAAAAIATVLRRSGLAVGNGMADASGLAAGDRLTSATLAAVLRLVTTTARLRDIVDGLPVAAWSGSLADRYRQPPLRVAAGVVRAKTGTLTGVSALAGLVRDRSGAVLAFALIADRTGSTPDAEQALDGIAARLARCGCA